MALKYNVIIPNALSEQTFVARVTKDAESRFTPSGTRVTNISVVVSRRYQVDGEWKDQSRFLTVTVWGDAAERAASVKKNNILAISYSLADMEARPYNANDGTMKAELKINRATVSRFAWVGGDGGDAGAPVTEEIGTGSVSTLEQELGETADGGDINF